MNWRLGLVRLWIVGSVFWAAWVLIQVLLNPPRSPVDGGGHAFQAGDLVWVLVMMVLPPVAVLVSGVLAAGAVRYVMQGFRP